MKNFKSLLSVMSCLYSSVLFASDPSTYYYPSTVNGNNTWNSTSAASLGWDVTKFNEAINYAEDQNSSAFIVLHKGNIVTENYWQGWNMNTTEIIHSAHKTISGVVFGIMQDQGLVDSEDYVSDYLTNWSNATTAQEAAVKIRHLQTMSSGMGERILLGRIYYQGAPETQWEYNTLAYRKINEIVEQESIQGDYHQYAKANLYDVIGMHNAGDDGTHSSYQSARDMARFGLLMLSNGEWSGQDILYNKAYLTDMTSPSQSINESYGRLTWLNGQNSYLAPKDTTVYQGALFPDAPDDMYAALGKDDKKIYVVPSLDLVVIRHGDVAPDGGGLAGNAFDNTLWQKLCAAIDCTPQTNPVILLDEGFESGTFNGWTVTGNPLVSTGADSSGTYGARVRKSSSIQKQVSTAGYNTVALEYMRRTKNMDNGEYLTVEWSVNGSNWTPVEQTQSTSWGLTSVTLPAGAGDSTGFRVRFKTSASANNERADIDEIVITAQ